MQNNNHSLSTALFSPPLVMIETVFNAITLWWSPMQCGVVSYVVSRTPAHGVLTRINDTVYSITGLDYNTTYNIIVLATSDGASDEYAANVTVTVTTISLQSVHLNKCTLWLYPVNIWLYVCSNKYSMSHVIISYGNMQWL